MEYLPSKRKCALSAAVAAVGPWLLVARWVAPAVAEGPAPTTQPAADSESAIKRAFANLASRDATVREEAFTTLLSLPPEELPTLEKAVAQSQPLFPAQVVALRQIVTQVYLSGEPFDGDPSKGFLGIQNMQEFPVNFCTSPADMSDSYRVGVVVTTRLPGFASGRGLRDGDIILSILDRPDVPIRTVEDFMRGIVEMRAGDIAHLQLLRQGQVITVAIKLGPRPLEAIPGGAISELLLRRQAKADAYWIEHFVPLLKEGVS